MGLTFNLRHLENHELRLEGEASAEALDLNGIDEMITIREPVSYDLTLERMGSNVLVQGHIGLDLDCQCVRCLREFTQHIALENWSCDLPLSGEERVLVNNDCIDLTPYVREDILLAFPQHPLCEPGCRGLLDPDHNLHEPASVDEQARGGSPAWAALNKLKF